MMIFNLKDAKSWEPVVARELIKILGKSYIETIKNNSKNIIYRDSMEEAFNLFSIKNDREKMINSVVIAFKSTFRNVLTYHACRPIEVDEYYISGIKPLCPDSIQEIFRRYFKSYFSEKAIECSIASVSTKTRDGYVHSVLDDRIFFEDCGHYLIYGSEYLCCLAIALPGASESTRDILKKYGKATVFICSLPFFEVTDLKHLVERLIADHFYRIAHDEASVGIVDYTIIGKKIISPKSVLKHYFPIKIKDPFKKFQVWNEKNNLSSVVN